MSMVWANQPVLFTPAAGKVGAGMRAACGGCMQFTTITYNTDTLIGNLHFTHTVRTGNGFFRYFDPLHASSKIVLKDNTNCYLCPVFKNSTIHGITVRHRWPTECRQIHLIQLPFQRESTGSQFPILHHRAECVRHYCARRALE